MAEPPQNTSPLISDLYCFKKPYPISGPNVLRIPEKNSLNFYVITKYICALLNSKGGTLLIGVEKNFTVRGRKLTRDEIDKFQRHVDEALKQFNPTVKGHEYSINFHPVVFEEGKKIAVRDFYVIEIRINSPDVEDLYFTHYDECWIKKPDNQIDLVPVTDLRAYMEKHLNKTFDAKKNNLQRQIDLYEGKGLESLRQDELLKLKKDVSTALYLVQQARAFQKTGLMDLEK